MHILGVEGRVAIIAYLEKKADDEEKMGKPSDKIK